MERCFCLSLPALLTLKDDKVDIIMDALSFKDVTEIVRKELNKVPGYKNRPVKNKLDRIERLPTYLTIDLVNFNPEVLKEFGKQGASPLLTKLLAEGNMEWLKKFTGIGGSGYIQAKNTKDPYIDELSAGGPAGIYQAFDLVLEAEGNIKPKLYGVSIPLSYFDKVLSSNELFINVHFRRLPLELASSFYETDDGLKPTDPALRNVLPGREFYPYGWDYLFFNLFTFFSTESQTMYSKNFHAQMPFQSAQSGKNVITVFPVADSKSIEDEQIIRPEVLDAVIKGIGRFVNNKIRNERGKKSTSKNETEANQPYEVTRASLSCSGLGALYMLMLFPHLNKLEYIKEAYLFDPPHTGDAHNKWVASAMAWAGNDKAKYIRVYSQNYPAFRAWETLINNRSTIAQKKPWIVLKNPEFINRSYTEFTRSPLSQDDQKKYEKEITAFEPYRSHAFIPAFLYKHALEYSGFTSKREIEIKQKEADTLQKFDPRRIPPIILQEIAKYANAPVGSIAQIVLDYLLESLTMASSFNGGVLGVLFEKKGIFLLLFIHDWAKPLQNKSMNLSQIADPLEAGAGGAAELYEIQGKAYRIIKLKEEPPGTSYFVTLAHELAHCSLTSSETPIITDLRNIFYPGVQKVDQQITVGRLAFMSEVLARRITWLAIEHTLSKCAFCMGKIEPKNIAKACFNFSVDNSPGRLSYYKQVNYVTDPMPTYKAKRKLIGTWLQNFWTKDPILSNKALDEIIKNEFNLAGGLLVNASDAEFNSWVADGLL